MDVLLTIDPTMLEFTIVKASSLLPLIQGISVDRLGKSVWCLVPALSLKPKRAQG